jgi:flagellar hook protein FlgE
LHDVLFVQRQRFDLVNADISGNIASQFSNYTTAANRQLVMASFQNSLFTKHIPVSALEEITQASGEQLVPPSHRKLGKG